MIVLMNDAPLIAYRNAGLDGAVAAASPHQLIVLLFEGARAALGRARLAIGRGDVAARGAAISKALAIIDDGLKASLDVDRGGQIAERLNALYDYMIARLAMANLECDVRKVDEIDQLLAELEHAWRQIGSKPQAAPPAEAPQGRTASLSYGKV
jgi:flagellar protein FliS